MTINKYEKLSAERKEMQAAGTMPEWMTTGGWQMFKSKYLYEADTVKEQYQRIARTASKHLPDSAAWEARFFEILWNGWVSCSTPILANMGTNRGMPVSCSGQYVGDSIDDFYMSRHEAAILTKYGFGTSGYLGDIRARGTPISVGGTASGVMPVLKGFIQDMRDVAQGTARRGSFATYIEPTHGDFEEVAHFVESNPDDANIGWTIRDSFVKALNEGDKEAHKRFKKTQKMKMVTGKGYYHFVDKANRHRPQAYINNDLYVTASNLCSEIELFSDREHTFTCVLSSMNASMYNAWKDTDAPFVATVFLHCVALEFIQKAEGINGLQKAVRATKKGMALGLGVCGFHTYLQSEMIAFESFEAHMFNNKLFKGLQEESKKASAWLATIFGEPEWCKGTGYANTHTMAVAPTKSTALIMGGVSEGINPDPAMTFTQLTAAGEVDRANPILLALMKKKGVYDRKHWQELVDSQGSVQNVDWLDDHEKAVFKTAFEINQEAILRLASTRQQWIDQGQSVNLFFSADEDEGYIAKIHQLAFEDENIHALYYCYSKSGVTGSKDECVACQ
jgi:ribonucleoside-diphosphate reductase alpha chain